jgi:hypothetical protein
MSELLTFRNIVVIALLLGATAAAFFDYQFQDHKISLDELIVLWVVFIIILIIVQYIVKFLINLYVRVFGVFGVNTESKLPAVLSALTTIGIGLFLLLTVQSFLLDILVVSYEKLHAGPAFRETARDFLNTNESPPTGLGLYSYLLMGDSNESNSARNKAAIEAYIDDFATFGETINIPRNEINGFFVFTLQDLEWVDRCQRSSSSEHIPQWDCWQGGKKKIYTLEELANAVCRD